EDRDAEEFHLADELLGAAGYEHYETSNYALDGAYSAHNLGYWRGDDYLGIGPSAVSTVDRIRSKNVADTDAYIRRVMSIGHAVDEVEPLDEQALRIERIALGLRTSRGIPAACLSPDARRRAEDLAQLGLCRFEGANLVLAGRGRALVDPIAAELI
ncbi:MAG: coproporphyrinogen III oxidase, partial [Luteolibacter sp.]